MADDTSRLFKVICPRQHFDVLMELGQKADRMGIGDSFKVEVNYIESKLAKEPLTWGDPLFEFHQLHLLVCRGSGSILYVHYGVDAERRIVYVKEFTVRPGHGLAGE